MLLDGGLATELEKNGYDLNHRLWSARLLLSDPAAIAAVHRSYLQAGSDCIITASYQASIEGFIAQGIDKKKAESLLELSVKIACYERDHFCEQFPPEQINRLRPLVAASIGPYGAYLADGSEYTGNYGVSRDRLYDFHAKRWEVLAESRADLIACETIPSLEEAEVIAHLADQTAAKNIWVSFSCKNDTSINDGSPIKEAVALFENCRQVIALGVNCTAPRFISGLIGKINRVKQEQQIVVYPNSGEIYDRLHKIWIGKPDPLDFARAAGEWLTKGARLLGGCCRTGPTHIKAIRDYLESGQLTHAASSGNRI
jgi:homocysteine S-methyltransferase